MKYQSDSNIFINLPSSSLERCKTDEFYRRLVKGKEGRKRKEIWGGQSKERKIRGERKEGINEWRSPHY